MERRLRHVGTGLTRAMLALCMALLGLALLLGTAQGAEYRKAVLLALAGGALLWKGLPWLCRRLAGLGALRAWLVLTLLCLAVKGAWVVLVQVPMEGDYATFWGYANSLAARPVIDGSRYIALFPHIFGYASFLSWFIALFGQAPLLAQWLNVALTAASGGLLFLLGRRLWGLESGIAVCLLWIVCPSQTIYNSLVLSEPLYTTLLLLFLALVTGPLPRRAGRAALLGAGAGAVLRWFNGVRPLGAILLIALALWRFCLAPDGLAERGERRRWLALLAALLATYAITGPLWQAHLTARLGQEPASTPGYSVLVGFNQQSLGRWNQADSDLLFSLSDQPGATAQQAQEGALAAAGERIASGEVDFPVLFREKLRGFLGSDSTCVTACRAVLRHTGLFSLICNGFYDLTLSLGAAGCLALWRRGERSAVLLLPLYVLGLTCAQMLVEVAGRYHYSMLPVLLLLAQRALIRPSQDLLQKNQKIP